MPINIKKTSGMTVIDLGASPGGWSKVSSEIIGTTGSVISIDINPFPPLRNVNIFIGDILNPKTWQVVNAFLASRKVDVVMSDMAPNFIQSRFANVARVFQLCEKALDIATMKLKSNGSLIVKFLPGDGEREFKGKLEEVFEKVVYFKPDASRKDSSEGYFIGLKYKGNSSKI